MSRKEEILRRAEQLQREDEKRGKAPPEHPYTGSGMVSRMPLGCWLWILGLLAIVFYAFTRYVSGVH